MPQATTQQATTIGQQIRESEAVRSGVSAIVDEISRRRAEITEVRGPVDGLKTTLDDLMKQAEDSRGRGLMMPYIGSGVGNGALVELVDGSVKYDLMCGIGPNFFGHSDPDLLAVALEGAMTDVTFQGYFQQNADAIHFSDRLAKEAGRNSRLRHAFLCNSGAMANDNALKICFHNRHPADRVLAFQGCFMGRSIAMSQIGDNAAYRIGVPTNIPIDYMPFFDEPAAQRMSAGDATGQSRYIDMCVWHLRQYFERYPDKHACFVFELVQGEGGYNTAPREYFTALMDVCRDHNVPVWVDEVQTFGRTTEMFAFEALDLGEYIDVCTIGKMSQVCAAIFTPEMNPKPGLLSGTFLGSSVALRVGRRMIERLREGDYYGEGGRIAKHHRHFVEGIKAIAQKHPDWFPHNRSIMEPYGGFGGMMRFSPFGGDKAKVAKACRCMYEEGVVTLSCGHGPYHVRILPPLGVMREEEWPTVFELIERGLAKAAS
ncbi:MAG: aminotransferase class III-fold pyridoxal phosphate-dependent enzyme [Phycisphaeraceae bacterium]|nr:MAG: aminotransferase class III-fold pyridoxal phosphate-dependent enzyme [Phycisphaeraceae bacterium]